MYSYLYLESERLDVLTWKLQLVFYCLYTVFNDVIVALVLHTGFRREEEGKREKSSNND